MADETVAERVDKRARSRRAVLALALGCAIALIVTAVFFAVRPGPNSATVTNPAVSGRSVGSALPVHFRLARLGGGKPVVLWSLVKGRPSVVNLFASWCPACARELDAFGRVSASVGSKVAFVGVDTSENDPARSEQLLSQAKVRFPVARDTASLEVAGSWGVTDLPVTFFVRSNGTIAREVLGAESLSVLRRNVAALLKGAS